MKPKEMAAKGQQIYREKYQEKLEREALGRYVAIDVEGERYFLGKTPDEALVEARNALPEGHFHLIRVGASGVYHLSSVVGDETDWKF